MNSSWQWRNVTIKGQVRDDLEKTPEMYEKQSEPTAQENEFVPGIHTHCYTCGIGVDRLPQGSYVTLVYEKPRTNQEIREYKEKSKYTLTFCGYCYTVHVKA